MIMKIIDFNKIVRIKTLIIHAQKIKKCNFIFAIIAIMILINILNTVLTLIKWR